MNYSSLIKTPKGDDFKKINEYQKALDGNKSSAFTASRPLGRRYFENTGIRCNNSKNNRYVFIDSIPKAGPQQLPKNGIYYSANMDFSKVSDTLNESSKYDCVKKTYTTVDAKGKKKKKTYYVAKETFISPNLNEMNMGQQFFIGSFAVLGLFLFYKGFLKR
jgi:hypothetical protein